MGKPRMIILIRHAQSEGNQNRQIHQTVPDHRVKLTTEGWNQAHEAGRRLRGLLKPTDTLQFYTSPYRRTRETAEGILQTLTSDDPEPSPFPRRSVKVWEEPRLREQDFGNFQPCSAAMEKMWQERADYGHFFYRIPNGESAADAYDRVSGFNETLWRSFEEEDFPSVCVLVTHGLMTRVFLMKWYHWSVEYFEDLRNVNHCEFIIMTRSSDKNGGRRGGGGKYVLQNELRTWSELKRQKALERGEDPNNSNTVSSPSVTKKRWGGCPEGCSHQHDEYPRRQKRRDTRDFPRQGSLPLLTLPSYKVVQQQDGKEKPPVLDKDACTKEEDDEAFPHLKQNSSAPKPLILLSNNDDSSANNLAKTTTHNAADFINSRLLESEREHYRPSYLEAGRDFGGTSSGAPTPFYDNRSDSAGYGFDEASDNEDVENATDGGKRMAVQANNEDETRWVAESGMASGARADALGDQGTESSSVEGEGEAEERSPVEADVTTRSVEEEEARDKSLRGSVY